MAHTRPRAPFHRCSLSQTEDEGISKYHLTSLSHLQPDANPPQASLLDLFPSPPREGLQVSSAGSPSQIHPASCLPLRKPEIHNHQERGLEKQAFKYSQDFSFGENDIILAVMGVTGVGKSTFISLLSDGKIETGPGLKSCIYHIFLDGRKIFLIDTPGFDDTSRSGSSVLKDFAFWLAATYTKRVRLSGVIYLHRISDDRIPGSAILNLQTFKKLCGEEKLNCVVLVTTHWTNLKTSTSVDRETPDARTQKLMTTRGFWGEMIENGSQVVKHDGSRQSALDIILVIVRKQDRSVLDIQTKLLDQTLCLTGTGAAQGLQSDLVAERRPFEQQLKEMKRGIVDAKGGNDERLQKAIKHEQAKAGEEIQKTQDEASSLRLTPDQIIKEQVELLEELTRQNREYRNQLKNASEALEEERQRQNSLTFEYERARRRDQTERLKETERQILGAIKVQEWIWQEHNQAVIAQLERQIEEQEGWYEHQIHEVRAAQENGQEIWERQLGVFKEREEELVYLLDKADKRIKELEFEQSKRKLPF